MTLDVRLLAALRQTSTHIPVSELAEVVHASASEIAARICVLRESGFDVETRPGFGYRLISSPDRIVADDIWSRLPPIRMVREILAFEETDSTNDAAALLGRQGERGGIAIFAERQRAGRGRFGRRWESEGSLGLWFSLLLRPEMPVPHWPRLTTWAAVSIAAAVEQATGLAPAIKWPNDVQLIGRKAAGILIEMGTDAEQKPFVVAGIGVNVNHASADFPTVLQPIAISLREAVGRQIDRGDFAAAILRELDRRYELLAAHFDSVLMEAVSRSSTLGERVRVQAGGAAIEGFAESLNEDGHLVLRMADGTHKTVSAGEVTLRTE